MLLSFSVAGTLEAIGAGFTPKELAVRIASVSVARLGSMIVTGMMLRFAVFAAGGGSMTT